MTLKIYRVLHTSHTLMLRLDTFTYINVNSFYYSNLYILQNQIYSNDVPFYLNTVVLKVISKAKYLWSNSFIDFF